MRSQDGQCFSARNPVVAHVDRPAARERVKAFGVPNWDWPIRNLTSGFFIPPSYFCLSRVPVVQRIERRFPKGKTAFLRARDQPCKTVCVFSSVTRLRT